MPCAWSTPALEEYLVPHVEYSPSGGVKTAQRFWWGRSAANQFFVLTDHSEGMIMGPTPLLGSTVSNLLKRVSYQSRPVSSESPPTT